MSRNTQGVSTISYASRVKPAQTNSFKSISGEKQRRRHKSEETFIVRTVPDVLELGNVSNCEFYTVGIPWAVLCIVMIFIGLDGVGSCTTYLPGWMWISGVAFTCANVLIMFFACCDGYRDKVVCAVIAIEVFALALIGTLPFAFVGLSYLLHDDSSTCKPSLIGFSWGMIAVSFLVWLDLIRRGFNLCCGCSCKYTSLCRESECSDCGGYMEDDMDG